MNEYRVNVFESKIHFEMDSDVIARVRYNAILDYWNGRSWQNGDIGTHKGLTRLKDGRYVLIIGTELQGKKDYAFIITKYEALQEILRSGNLELLELRKWKELKEIYLNCFSKNEQLEEMEEI